MKALVTGANSGIGKEIAKELYKRGYDLILVARDKDRLRKVNKSLGGGHRMISVDLSVPENCIKLYEAVKEEKIDVLVNNAGFGVFGEFTEIQLEKEVEMINVNLIAMHTLMKLFLKDFERQKRGYILNVSSSAAFLPGPLLAAYYASKSYIYSLSVAVAKEQEKKGSPVQISVFCPGPVQTDFNKRAGVKFAIKGITSEYAGKYAVKKLFEGDTVIIPGASIKAGAVAAKLLPTNILTAFAYNFQRRKRK